MGDNYDNYGVNDADTDDDDDVNDISCALVVCEIVAHQRLTTAQCYHC